MKSYINRILQFWKYNSWHHYELLDPLGLILPKFLYLMLSFWKLLTLIWLFLKAPFLLLVSQSHPLIRYSRGPQLQLMDPHWSVACQKSVCTENWSPIHRMKAAHKTTPLPVCEKPLFANWSLVLKGWRLLCYR